MRLSKQVKPISYLKANAAEILRDLGERQEPYIITQNGEAKAVILDLDSYEDQLEDLAFLKLVAIGKREITEGRFEDARAAIEQLQRGE